MGNCNVYIFICGFFWIFKPGALENILAGKVWVFEITQAWALGGLSLMTIPSLMVFLSLALPAKVNRWTNIIVAIIYIIVSIGNSLGESWAFK